MMRHTHRVAGMILTHRHEHGADPHGYFGHAEDGGHAAPIPGETYEMVVTAAEITRELRILYPRPVRLSVRTVDGEYRVRMPQGPGTLSARFLADSLTRRFGRPVSASVERHIDLRGGGRDVEFSVRVAPAAPVPHRAASLLSIETP